MNDKVLIGKLGIGVVGLLCGLVLLRQRSIMAGPQERFQRVSWALLALSRLIVFSLVFGLVGIDAQSDVATVCYPQAKAALVGGMPYRDFWTSYAPLYSHLAAVAVWVWDSPKSIVLLTILFELAAFPLWASVAFRLVGDQTARLATVLYLSSALPLMNVAIDGQNQIWVGLFLALGLHLLIGHRNFWSGVAFSISVVAVKFLPIIFAPAYFAAARNRTRLVLGAVIVPGIVYGSMWAAGADVLLPLKVEGADSTSGNLLFLFNAVSVVDLRAYALPLTLLGLGAACLATLVFRNRRVDARDAMASMAVILLALLLCAKKSYTNYLVVAFFPLCLAIADSDRKKSTISFVLFSIFGTLAVLEPSLWFRWIGRRQLADAWLHAAGNGGPELRFVLFLVCDLALIAFYFWYACVIVRAARTVIYHHGEAGDPR